MRHWWEYFTSLKQIRRRRALAYQVGHIHKKIKFYRKFIPADDVGRKLREELNDDPHVSFFDLPGIDWQKNINNLKRTFNKPEFAPIQAEWERLKKERKGDPSWYTLFGGPNDLRKLSLQIGKGSYYEILYRHWSDFAHAGGAFNNISKGSSGEALIKPVRCPDGVEQACNFACQISMETVFNLVKVFAADEWPNFQQKYFNEIRPRLEEHAVKRR